jgi:hypothetical protein
MNQIMAHRHVGFLETRKIVEKWSQPGLPNPAFSLGVDSTRGYAKPDEESGIILRQVKAVKPQANRLDGTRGEGKGR